MRALLWLFTLAAAGVYICGPVVDPDLWWHITVGRWMLANHTIPTVDLWNMFGVGQPWRAYSWLTEIIFAFVDGRFGVHGLLALKFILAAGLGIAFGYAFWVISRDGFIGMLLGVFAVIACFNHFTLRPQSFVWIFLALLLVQADRIAGEGLTLRRALALGLIMCLWANTHITTALGIGTLALWLFSGRASLGLVGRACGAAFLGTLATPYLGGEWLTFFRKTGHPFQMQSIAEFAPATVMQHSTAFLVIIAAVVVTFAYRRPNLLEPAKVILVAGFSLAGLAVVKFLPFAIIVWCAAAALVWRRGSAAGDALGNLGEGLRRLKKLVEALPSEGLSFVLICTMIVNVHNRWGEPLNRQIVPVDAVDFIQARQLPHPILNDFGRGGYMMYRFSDASGKLEHLVPIDGRTNVTPHDVWEKAHAAFVGGERWAEFRDLVKPETILWPSESPFMNILRAENAWCLAHRTGDPQRGYVVFVKREYAAAHPADFAGTACAGAGS